VRLAHHKQGAQPLNKIKNTQCARNALTKLKTFILLNYDKKNFMPATKLGKKHEKTAKQPQQNKTFFTTI